MKLKTDNKWKPFRYGSEVPKRVLTSNFDHLEDACDGFIYYRRQWLHLSDFLKSENPDLKDWHGIAMDTFFSATVIQISNDGERYKIGRVYS
jgi:hypothetical protein